MELQLVQNSVVETAASPPNTTATITIPSSAPVSRVPPALIAILVLYRSLLANLCLGLEVVMVLELRIPGEGAVELVMLMHGLDILDILVKVEGVFLVHSRVIGGVGLLDALPAGAFIVHVAGIAGLFKGKILPGFRQRRARGGLLRFLEGRTRFAVYAPVLRARSMARFAAHAGQELAGVVNRVAAFLAPAVNMAANTVLVLGVVLFRIKLGFLLGFLLG